MPEPEPDNAIATGCRPDQLFGAWAIEPAALQAMLDVALKVDLAQLAAESAARAQARAEAAPARRYDVDEDGIARLDLTGPLTKYLTSFQAMFGGTSTVLARRALREAARDPEVRGILLVIDSPGGTAAGTADLAAEVRHANTLKPVFAYIEDQGCSAAYWIATQARQVRSNESAAVGSIGTFVVLQDQSGRYAQEGVKVHVVSSAPPHKGAFVPGTEVTPAQIGDMQRRVTDLNDVFVNEFAQGRRLTRTQADALADGRVHVGRRAHELGLTDGVAALDEVRAALVRETTMPQQPPNDDKDVRAQLAQQQARAERAERELLELRAQHAPKQDPVEAALAALPAEQRGVVEGALKVEREKRASLEQAGKLAAAVELARGFKNLALDAPKFGPVLVACEAALSAEHHAELLRVLRSADTLAGGAKVGDGKPATHQIGDDGLPKASGPAAELQRIADGLLAKGEAKSPHAAYELACSRNPKLVRELRAEERKQAGGEAA